MSGRARRCARYAGYTHAMACNLICDADHSLIIRGHWVPWVVNQEVFMDVA